MGLRTQRNGPAVTNPVVSPRLTPMRHNTPIVSCDHTITAIAAAMSPAPGTIQGQDGLQWGPSCEPMVARGVAHMNLTSARQLNSEATQDWAVQRRQSRTTKTVPAQRCPNTVFTTTTASTHKPRVASPTHAMRHYQGCLTFLSRAIQNKGSHLPRGHAIVSNVGFPPLLTRHLGTSEAG